MTAVIGVDLFCGAGGLTHGLLKSNVKMVAGFDIEESCRYAYETNNQGARFINKDVASISADEINSLYPKNCIKLLAGCAPCQPFSTYSQGREAEKDSSF